METSHSVEVPLPSRRFLYVDEKNSGNTSAVSYQLLGNAILLSDGLVKGSLISREAYNKDCGRRTGTVVERTRSKLVHRDVCFIMYLLLTKLGRLVREALEEWQRA